jgi:hypothetical protein
MREDGDGHLSRLTLNRQSKEKRERTCHELRGKSNCNSVAKAIAAAAAERAEKKAAKREFTPEFRLRATSLTARHVAYG